MSRHLPVLLKEVLEILSPAPGQVVADVTIGYGGHSAEFLKRGARLVGLDLDPANLKAARARLGGTFELHHANFAGLPGVLGGIPVDGVLADLGLASPQIDDPARGFTYLHDGPLDMRMDTTRGKTAAELLNTMDEEELAAAIRDLGDEPEAAGIARKITASRPLRTTLDLTRIVCEVRRFTLERAAGAKLHPAARTFQAIRMRVNREGPNLERLLAVLPECLKPGGVAAIISFHSGEDRLVKHAFREGKRAALYSEIAEEPVRAGEEEVARNPRSRAAKLRWARKSGR